MSPCKARATYWERLWNLRFVSHVVNMIENGYSECSMVPIQILELQMKERCKKCLLEVGCTQKVEVTPHPAPQNKGVP